MKIVKRFPLPFAGLFFGFFFFFAFFLFYFYPTTHFNIWRGYYTIIIRQKEGHVFDPEKCRRRLHATSLVTEATETVSFSCFNNMEEIPLSEIGKRLDPLDPRIDPYMHKKKAYFHLNDTDKILYIASPLHPLLFYINAALYFSPYVNDFRIQDIHLLEILLVFCMGCFFLLIFHLVYKKGSQVKASAFMGILPWIPGLLSGDIMSVVSLILLYPSWFFLFEEAFIVFKNSTVFGWNGSKKRNVIIRSVIFLAVLFITMVFSFLQERFSFTAILPSIAQLFFIMGYCLLFYSRNRKKEHRIFEGVPIRLFFKRKYLFANVKKIPFLLTLGVVIFLFSIYYFYRSPFMKIKGVYPFFEAEKKNLTIGNLKVLWEKEGAGFLPDLSDYIVHVAYQEGLLFGTTYTFPSLSEGLIVSYYEKEPFTEKIIRENNSIKKYTDSWLEDVLLQVHRNSVEYMLFRQEKAASVAIQPIGNYYQCRFPKIHILSIFLCILILIFFVDFYLTPSFLYDTKRFAIRRLSNAA